MKFFATSDAIPVSSETSPFDSSAAARRTPALQSEELQGAIEQVVFSSEQGWSVLKVRTDQGTLATVCGTAFSAAPGERIRCRGRWTQHPRFGRQLEAERIDTAPPVTVDAIEKYLASGVIEGVGPHFARKLVNHFGTKLPEIIQQSSVYLESVPGIGPERRERIAQSWHKHRDVRDIMMFLHQHGVGPRRAAQIHRRYGDAAIRTLRQNPYRLIDDIDGIGFATANEIAKRLGIAGEHEQRLEAGLRAVLQRESLQGHCATGQRDLLEGAMRLLDVPHEAVSAALTRALDRHRLVLDEIAGEPLIYSLRPRMQEIALAAHLARLQGFPRPWGRLDIQRCIEAAENRLGKRLRASQYEVVRGVLESKVSIITGGPGSGKTTVTQFLVALLGQRLHAMHLCAPTGRAARRLSRDAATIHRLLRGAPGAKEFGFNAENPLDTQAVIVDESSMIDLELMCALVEAMPDGAALILIGDVDQLPSVGPGQVLYDLIESGEIAVHRLTENHRQAEDSHVVRNAYRINRGLPPLPSEDPKADFHWRIENGAEAISRQLIEIVSHELPCEFGLNSLRDIQVLTPMRRGDLGTHQLNRTLQSLLMPAPKGRISVGDAHFGIGDRLVQLTNDSHAQVYNGDTGHLVRINEGAKTFAVQFDEDLVVEYDFDQIDDLALAYGMTVHKSQGSEYPAVVIAFSTGHYPLLGKRLLYTAATRGRRVYLVGEERAVHIALSNGRSELRRTGLKERLRQAKASARGGDAR